MSKQLTVCGVTIKQDAEGRYCLNDLHKAAGGEPKHKPAEWLRYSTAKDLIDELKVGNPTLYPLATAMGRFGGTFVVKELVYAYAMWISPKFHLEVIRSYDRLATEGVAELEAGNPATKAAHTRADSRGSQSWNLRTGHPQSSSSPAIRATLGNRPNSSAILASGLPP